jgi:broad specificity phosphatase PhoE
MQLTLIRHLPTEWNKKMMLQGRRDIGLCSVSEDLHKGIQQNKLTLDHLSPFDLVLASTLKRTHQTAGIYGYTCETESLLDELDFGPFEGQPKERIMEVYGDLWIENPKDLVLGESLENLEKRIVLFLEKYRKMNNVLVFGHGSWIRAMISFHQNGHINQMNKMTVGNNACITLNW